METIEQQITALKSQLTGDLFSDIETQQKSMSSKSNSTLQLSMRPNKMTTTVVCIAEVSFH
jgi:hypothetical protein